MSDPYAADVKLLLHANDTDGSTTFTDSSQVPATIYGEGYGAAISTAQSVFGGSSYYSDGGGWLRADTFGAAAFLAGDWTIEFWIRPDAADQSADIVGSLDEGSSAGVSIRAGYTGTKLTSITIHMYDNTTALANIVVDVSAQTSASTAWEYVAVCKASTTYRTFCNGTLCDTTTPGVTIATYTGSDMYVGASSYYGYVFIGYIDEVRLTSVARYTSSFTTPSVEFSVDSISYADLTGPSPTFEAAGGEVGVGTFANSAPHPLLSFFGGANLNVSAPNPIFFSDAIRGNVAVSAPAPTLQFFGGAIAAITVPAPTFAAAGSPGASIQITAPRPRTAFWGGAFGSVAAQSPLFYASGHASAHERELVGRAPSPQVSALGGANLSTTLPRPYLTVTGTIIGLGTAALRAPSLTLSSNGTTAATARADLMEAPMPSLIGLGGAVLSITIPKGTFAASGTTGAVGNAAVTLPLFQLTAAGTAQPWGSANLLAPAPQMGLTAQAWLIPPGATLTAIGTAVVAVTYEAYAVNLKHNARDARDPTRGEQFVDEVTHYTNFPFDRVVRYKNSYFGMNSTGLYLLGGTTDDGADIQFAVETCKTDFDKVEQKTLVSAYFGGRIGSAETITLLAGEASVLPYTYTTPRTDDAQSYRQVFGRGVKNRYYALAVAGSDTFELDTIDIELDILTRRI